LVKAAREEELKRIYQEGVYVRASALECEGTPLKLEWVDVSKGDSNNEESHSGQRGETCHRPLRASSLMNAFMTKDKGKEKKLLVSWGNSRDQQRTNIFQVTLNPCWEVDEKHGTPDANEIFQKDYTEHLSSKGAACCSDPAIGSWMHVPHNLLSVAVASHPNPKK